MIDVITEDRPPAPTERLERLLTGSPTVLVATEVRHMRVYRSLLDHVFNEGLWWGDIPVGLIRRRSSLAASQS